MAAAPGRSPISHPSPARFSASLTSTEIPQGDGDGPGDNRGDNRGEGSWFGHPGNRAVVVTAETEPDFSSGAAAWTPDEGRTWYQIPGASGYWAVAFANPQAGWFVGNNGQILKISF